VASFTDAQVAAAIDAAGYEDPRVKPALLALLLARRDKLVRYWTMTGKLDKRLPQLVDAKRNASLRTLALLDEELASRAFIGGDRYTIADIAIYAYASRAEEAGLSLEPYPHFRQWIERVESQPRFLGTVHPYSIDPASANELP